MNDLRKLATTVVERARTEGLAGCEVLLTILETRRTTARRSGGTESAVAPRVDVRVWRADGRAGVGDAAGSDLDAALRALSMASGRAGEGAQDPLAGPPERMDVTTRGLQIADLRWDRLENEDRRDVVLSNEEAVRSAARGVTSGGFVYEEQRLTRVYRSSRGVDAVEVGTHYRLAGRARVAGRGGGDVSGEVRSRHFADVATIPLGVELGRRAALLGQVVPLPSEPLPVVLEPRALGVLLPLMMPAFDADAIDAGRSWITPEQARDGAVLGAARLHIIDDAAQPGALETRAFDDRGVGPMPLPLVREGEVGALYLSPRAARARGTRPSGHTRFDGGLWTGNLIVRAGQRSRNMMFPDIGRYLLIDEVLAPTGIDPVRGRLSVPVRVMLGELGAALGTIGTAKLTGTFAQLFGGVVEMASDHERHGAVDASTWVVEGLSLDGLATA